MDIVLVVAAYLIGSLTFGRIAGVIKGINLAERDTPGASGTFRQLGAGWGIGVAVADIAKGLLVAYLSGFGQAVWVMPLMGMALVAGHNWPVFFGFKGGGGIAPTIGFFAFLYPVVVGTALLIAVVIIGLYWQLVWKRNRKLWYPIPIGAVVGYSYALLALWPTGIGFWAFVLVSVVVALRGLRMTQKGH